MIKTLEDPHLVPYDLMAPSEWRNYLKESGVVVRGRVDGPTAVHLSWWVSFVGEYIRVALVNLVRGFCITFWETRVEQRRRAEYQNLKGNRRNQGF